MKVSFLLAFSALGIGAQAADIAEQRTDSARHVDLDEAIVTASPKENAALRRQAVSASSLSRADLDAFGVRTMRGISAIAPSFFMPAYGSGVTGATYVRGVGSRAGTPAVGLYVDNQPFLDKGGYSFGFQDVERIDVLRGPQGTLYGRNTMGGLVRITTVDPLTAYGTDVRLGASGRNAGRYANLNTYLHPTANFALSLGAFYDGQGGFFRNTTLGHKADAYDAFGVKTKMVWQLNEAWRLGLNVNYEYRDERANPYAIAEDTMTHIAAGTIGQNRQSYYRRNMLNAAFHVEWQGRDFKLTSITAFQHLDDRTFLDMDFMAIDYFSTLQRQKAQTFTQEIVAKSRAGRRWEWTTGAFYAYQRMKMRVPVNFYKEGIDAYLNGSIARSFANAGGGAPSMQLRFTDEELAFHAAASMPTVNVALFHQSTFHDFFFPRLSLTLGLRADYDYQKLGLDATSTPVSYYFNYRNQFSTTMAAQPVIRGGVKDHSWEVLPKVALQYDFANNRGNVYALASNGYRSGGFNIQTYSSLSQSLLQRQMMQGVLAFSTQEINKLPLPDAAKQRIIESMTASIASRMPAEPDLSTLRYRPEKTWNFEVGTHLNFFGTRLQADASLFLMNTRNLQLTRFAASGFGRETVNAGKSRSLGGEVSLRASFFDRRLFVMGSYGYAHATFTEYDEYVAGATANVSRKGKRIPYTPQHTMALSADFRQPLRHSLVKALFVGADVTGAGSIYWDTANSIKEPGYALVSARLGAEIGANVEVSLYARNIGNAAYNTFSFANLGRRLTQQGTPRYFGAEVKVHF